MKSVIWFRGMDLRLKDHGPLSEGLAQGRVIPAFILDAEWDPVIKGESLSPSLQMQRDGLIDLSQCLLSRGSKLHLLPGPSFEALARLAHVSKVDQVLAYWSMEPKGSKTEREVQRALGEVPLRLFEGSTLTAPERLRNRQGRAFRVFTPFAKAFRVECQVSSPRMEIPAVIDTAPAQIDSLSLSMLGGSGNPRVLKGGEGPASERLTHFLEDGLEHYASERDRVDLDSTSRLSQDLHFGFLSVAQVWHAVNQASEAGGANSRECARIYCNELLWREFAYHLLFENAEVLSKPFRAEFENFPWINDEPTWLAWVTGHTGYPAVDAAARQLLQTGFVHNRARMVTASFLTKHLMQDYRLGEAHFLNHLSDADLACNNMGWQWSAGCGVDAQPWFRIFHPVLQGKRFDPLGDYVRQWVPELAELPTRYIHAPWEAPQPILEAAHVKLGVDYPLPIVDHAWARERFLTTVKAHLSASRALNGNACDPTSNCTDV